MPKILVAADLHGFLPEVQECDLLLIAGDICIDGSPLEQARWLSDVFQPWLEAIPARNVVACAGNHDVIWERNPSLVPKDLRWTYLQDEHVVVDGLKIWGTPWQPIFLPLFDWAFNATEDKLEMAFDLIPHDTDILVCHGPPYGYGDKTYTGEHVGSKAMLDAIRRVQPEFVVCGHIHCAHGRYKVGRTCVVNASLINETYTMLSKPILLTKGN